MKVIKWILFLIILIGGALVLLHPKTASLLVLDVSPSSEHVYEIYDEFSYAFSDVPTVGSKEVSKLLGNPNLILVDVRTEQERATSSIPTSISREVFEEKYLSDKRKLNGKTVVTFCTIGIRSGLYAKKLLSKNIRVKNLKGSLLAWVNENGKLITPDGTPTNRLQVFSEEWKLVPAGYEPVW